MPVYTRDNVSKAIKAICQGKSVQIFLIFGDRFLCRQVVDNLLVVLLPDQAVRKQNVTLVDGDKEDPISTLNSLKSYSLFAGKKIIRVSDSKLLHSKSVAKNIWGRAQKAWDDKDSKRAGCYLAQFAAAGSKPLDELCDLSAAKWKVAFGFNRPASVAWLKEAVAGLEDKDVTPKQIAAEDESEQYIAAFEGGGIPGENILVLLAETVDKRKKFYKFIVKTGVVFDLSVDTGSSKAAKTGQEKVLKELVLQTLAEFGKKIEPRALGLLIDRVGFHPVAVVRETEKLALFADQKELLSHVDVEEVVGRTREDALFELTEAFADRNLQNALLLGSRLYENGTHPLVLVAGMRNMMRKLLLVRALKQADSPVFVEGMNYAAFQKGYLPDLKERKGELLVMLPTHPYALYMMFAKARNHTIAELVWGLKKLLKAELSMKSSSVPPLIVFEHFLLQVMCKGKKTTTHTLF